MIINFDNDENVILGFLSSREKEVFSDKVFPEFKSHVFIKTSGSTSSPKWVALSKHAILNSAEIVNKHIESSLRDSWFTVLPNNHMAGLAVYARAYLQNVKVQSYVGDRWQPHEFVKQLKNTQATLTSLVPTQVYDLVNQNLAAPESLRVVFVGGGHLSEKLYLKARVLKWPILPTYGMTECCSQIATAPLNSLKKMDLPELEVLPHCELNIDDNQRLIIHSTALYTAYINNENSDYNVIKRINDYFLSEDSVEILEKNNKTYLNILGRVSQLLKVSGILVNEYDLNKKWQSHSSGFLVLVPDERKGYTVVLVIEQVIDNEIKSQVNNFNKGLKKQEKVSAIYSISKIPLNSMSKLNKNELLKTLGFI
ncbi:MAG: AMP-binding protein [Bdellovibrionales bacterium]|nr:AMP-binding protein [Bdellovibrionales bacterium]